LGYGVHRLIGADELSRDLGEEGEGTAQVVDV
jgi:hypothetical protein